MSKKATRIAGILGGMGPEATARFFELVIKNTAAARDQEHLRIIVCNWPQIPDRTKAILYGGENPLPRLTEGLKVLGKSRGRTGGHSLPDGSLFFTRTQKKNPPAASGPGGRNCPLD